MSEDKYSSLRKQLERDFQFPLKYMFKFIVPDAKIEEIKPLFETGVMKERASSTGKYRSITITMIVLSPEDVIDKYKSVAHIKGIVAL
jgi:putative lipoic acid-binding regulatory protein